jgi:hypothetical protein
MNSTPDITDITNMLIVGAVSVMLVIGLSFAVGYFVGSREQRPPTFAESVYHHADVAKCEKCAKVCK